MFEQTGQFVNWVSLDL